MTVPGAPADSRCDAMSRGRWGSLVLGCLCSGVLAYLAIRGVAWSEVATALARTRYVYLLLSAAGIGTMLALRAWRWGAIVRPIRRLPPWTAFAITAVGYLAILVIPFRIGELMRPYLLREREGVPFSTGLATIAVERCLDGLAFAGLIVLATPWLPLPAWAAPAGYLLSGGYLAGLSFLLWIWFARDRFERSLSRLVRRLAPRRAPAVEETVKSFLAGLALLPNVTGVWKVGLLSVLIWLLAAVSNYVSFLALDLALPWNAAVALQILVTAGVLLPAAPGFVGNFQFFAVMALGLYGVGEAVALSYAILIHATVLVVHIVLGVVCGLALQIGWGSRLWGNLAAIRSVPRAPSRLDE
jgi:uncharacterized protein (TIRG00374 family)